MMSTRLPTRMLSLFCAITFLCGAMGRASAAPPTAAAAKNGTDNAALYYWQAWGVIVAHLTREELDPVEQYYAQTDLDIAPALEKMKLAFFSIERAAQQPRCNWGVDARRDGFYTVLPHCSAARQLARMLNARAVYYFEHGEPDKALDDIFTMLHMARRVGPGEPIISVLVQIAIEGIGQHTLARYLPELNEKQLASLSERLAKLPPVTAIYDGVTAERDTITPWLLELTEDISASEELVEMISDLEMSPLATYAILKGCDSDPRRFEEMVQGAADYQTRAAKILKLDRTHFLAEWAILKKEIEKDNPLAFDWLLNLEAMHNADARRACKYALLEAAIAMVQEGPAALKRFEDPYGEGAFRYRPVGDGFELESQLRWTTNRRSSIRVGFFNKD